MHARMGWIGLDWIGLGQLGLAWFGWFGLVGSALASEEFKQRLMNKRKSSYALLLKMLHDNTRGTKLMATYHVGFL